MEKHPLKGKKGKRWLRKVKNLPATDGKKKNDEEDQSQLVIGGCYYSSDDDDVHRCCVVRDFCKTRQSYLLVFEGTLGKESEWIKQDRIALAALYGGDGGSAGGHCRCHAVARGHSRDSQAAGTALPERPTCHPS